ncbi:tyrosine-type recombinase/integrase [candidate division KSB1 bacterium]
MKKISRALSRIGFEWASCHNFRHTYISHLVMQGVPLTTVQHLVGHRNFTTTLKYAHLAPSHKNRMIEKRPY